MVEGGMRTIGSPSLEWELQVGDIISSRRYGVYVVLGEKIPDDKDYHRVLILSNGGNIFEHWIPLGRSFNYPLVPDGIYSQLGVEQ